MSIKIHHGAPGSYKTSGAVMDDFIPCVKSGRVVVTNVRGLTLERVREAVYPVTWLDRLLRRNLEPVPVFPEIPEGFDIIHLDTTKKAERDRLAIWFHWAPPGCLFLIDEAQSIFSPRWAAKDIAALDYPGGHDAASLNNRPACWNDALEMHRHYGWDMTLTTPNIRSLRGDVREVAEGAYKHRNLAVVGWRGRYMEGFHDAQDSGTASQIVSLVSKKISKEVWSLYDSTTTGTFADTLAGIKLWKDPKILVLLGIVAFAFYMAFRNPLPAVLGGKKADSKSVVAVSPPVAPVPMAVAPAFASGIHGNSGGLGGVPVGTPHDIVPPSNESDWQAIGHYQTGGKRYVVLRRGDAVRTVINPKGATYDVGRVDLQLDGHLVSNHTGTIRAQGMGRL